MSEKTETVKIEKKFKTKKRKTAKKFGEKRLNIKNSTVKKGKFITNRVYFRL